MTQASRGKGQSAIACAAYRAGENLYCDYYGETSDYTKKGGVLYTEIFLPTNAPAAFFDRQTLWNSVESTEKHPKAQLAYSFDIALQNELTYEENLSLARRFCREQLLSRGMIADMAVHSPEKEGGIQNPHFHILCPIRPLTEDGKWGVKQHRVYELDEGGNRIRDADGNYVFNAVPTTDWGKPETLDYWREQWAAMVNAEFERKQLDCRIDHRTLEAQGLDELPTVHEGPAVRAMEKRGIRTEIGDFNRMIKTSNSFLKKLRALLEKVRDAVAALKAEAAETTAPTVRACLAEYYQGRNEYATLNFGHGATKAKTNNLKQYAAEIAFLESNGIDSVEDLERFTSALHSRSHDLSEKSRAKTARMKELSELLRHCDNFQRYKPLADELNGIKYKKRREAFKAEHDSDLTMFYMAKRVLQNAAINGRITSKAWRSELDALTAEYNSEIAERDRCWREAKELDKLVSHVRDGQAKLVPEQTQTRKQNYEQEK